MNRQILIPSAVALVLIATAAGLLSHVRTHKTLAPPGVTTHPLDGSIRLRVEPSKGRSEEHTSELQSHLNLVCRLLLEKKKTTSSTSSQQERLCASGLKTRRHRLITPPCMNESPFQHRPYPTIPFATQPPLTISSSSAP